MNNKDKIQKDIFGHEHFRSFQEEVVDSIINKQDVLTILPTGGGKSLCYREIWGHDTNLKLRLRV